MTIKAQAYSEAWEEDRERRKPLLLGWINQWTGNVTV